MKIQSLARQTDLIFSRFSGHVHDRGDYVLIQTPTNPDYHWGNYIIFSFRPRPGDFEKWQALYRSEFPYYDVIRHMTFTWNESGNDAPVFEPFLRAGFELDHAKVLATSTVNQPPKFNSEIEVRKLSNDSEWEQAIQLQVLCRDLKFDGREYERFKRKQFEMYRNMAKQGMGDWFGAFLAGELVGDLGIFHSDGLVRFQNVGTHPEYRRRGICGTLVYKTAQIALQTYGLKTLVMEADAEYHAAAIYESVGFRAVEENRSLSWWEAP